MGITLRQNLVCDNSTLANFKAWAGNVTGIASFLQTSGSGLTQTSDTGQVNWSSIASVPAANSYVYEIYKNTDALSNFYFKIEYGTGTGSTNTNPRIRLSIGTTTNGAGTLGGFILGPVLLQASDPAVPSTSLGYDCVWSAAPGRLAMLMWRDSNPAVWFGIERSTDTSGNYTGTFVTLFTISNTAAGNNGGYGGQQTLVFGQGATYINGTFSNTTPSSNSYFWNILGGNNGSISSAYNSMLFDGSVAMSPLFHMAGYFQPARIGMIGGLVDFNEGCTYVIAAGNMPYGVSKTYVACGRNSSTQLGKVVNNSNGNNQWCWFLTEFD